MRTKRATRHAQNLLLTVSAGVVALLPSGARAQQVPAAEQVPVVTLSEARRRAIAVDPDAVAASQRIRVAGWERRAATADLLAPRLNGSISYIRFSDPFFNFGTGSISPNAAAASSVGAVKTAVAWSRSARPSLR